MLTDLYKSFGWTRPFGTGRLFLIDAMIRLHSALFARDKRHPLTRTLVGKWSTQVEKEVEGAEVTHELMVWYTAVAGLIMG